MIIRKSFLNFFRHYVLRKREKDVIEELVNKFSVGMNFFASEQLKFRNK